jgi:hypothetical protein
VERARERPPSADWPGRRGGGGFDVPARLQHSCRYRTSLGREREAQMKRKKDKEMDRDREIEEGLLLMGWGGGGQSGFMQLGSWNFYEDLQSASREMCSWGNLSSRWLWLCFKGNVTRKSV